MPALIDSKDKTYAHLSLTESELIVSMYCPPVPLKNNLPFFQRIPPLSRTYNHLTTISHALQNDVQIFAEVVCPYPNAIVSFACLQNMAFQDGS